MKIYIAQLFIDQIRLYRYIYSEIESFDYAVSKHFVLFVVHVHPGESNGSSP